MQTLNVAYELNTIMMSMAAVKRQVFTATGDDRIQSQFQDMHKNIERCREIILASAVVSSHDCSAELHAVAPKLQTIGLNPDGVTIALIRNTPTCDGETYVQVTVHELQSILDDVASPPINIPSYFVRESLRKATPTTTTHQAMNMAMESFLRFCGSTSPQTLATALLNANNSYVLANSVGLVMPVGVKKMQASKRIFDMVRDVCHSAIHLYGNHQSFAITDVYGTPIALPPNHFERADVASFAKRHFLAFEPLWKLHKELKGSDEMHDIIWEIK